MTTRTRTVDWGGLTLIVKDIRTATKPGQVGTPFSGGGGGGDPVVGTSTITGGTDKNILYNNAGILGEYTITGSGTVVAMKTSPVFVTPTLGAATATSINKVNITAPVTGSTLTIADGKTLTASNTLTLSGNDGASLSIGAGGTLGAAAFTSTINNTYWSGTQLSIANGGTGQTSKAAAFDALSPLTTAGDILYGGASGTGTRLAAGTSSQVLIGGTTPSWSSVSLSSMVSGNLPVANLGSGTSASSATFWRGDGSWSSTLTSGLALGSNLTWSTDGGGNIGASGANRVDNVYVKTSVFNSGNYYLANDTGAFFMGTSSDVVLRRDAANIFAQRNSTNGQTHRLYSTYTDASNGTWAFMDAGVSTAATLTIDTSGNGTGASGITKFRQLINGSSIWDYNINSASQVTFQKLVNFSNSITVSGGGGVSVQNGAGINVYHGGVYGYANAGGAGGSVTQTTSKSTGVTLNKQCGQVTMNNASLAATTAVSFTLTNSFITATDNVYFWIVSGGTANSYIVTTAGVSAGSATCQVYNFTGGALGEALVIGYSVTKATIT